MDERQRWDDMGYPLEIPKKLHGQWQGIRATSINGDILCPILWNISGIHYIRSNMIFGCLKIGDWPQDFLQFGTCHEQPLSLQVHFGVAKFQTKPHSKNCLEKWRVDSILFPMGSSSGNIYKLVNYLLGVGRTLGDRTTSWSSKDFYALMRAKVISWSCSILQWPLRW